MPSRTTQISASIPTPGVNGSPVPGGRKTTDDFVTAPELLAMDLPEPTCIVDGVVTAGLNLLVARPKLGKSWLALALAIAIANGGQVLGKLPVEQGAVLYLALEDHARRLKSRLLKLLAGARAPERLHLANDWPRLDRGGMDHLRKWINRADSPRLIVLDTLAKVRKASSRHGDRYADDYADVAEIKSLADDHEIGILAIHHVRKLAGDDILDEVSGSIGVTAAADTILIVRRERGQHDAVLYVTGRDVDEQELALGFDKDKCRWSILGPADEFRASTGAATQRVIEVLARLGKPMKPKDIAKITGENENAVKVRLWRASKEGKIKVDGQGNYSAPT